MDLIFLGWIFLKNILFKYQIFGTFKWIMNSFNLKNWQLLEDIFINFDQKWLHSYNSVIWHNFALNKVLNIFKFIIPLIVIVFLTDQIFMAFMMPCIFVKLNYKFANYDVLSHIFITQLWMFIWNWFPLRVKLVVA